jgi:hypothetical protein
MKEWRDVLMKRIQNENPERFSKEEKEQVKDVEDRQLKRAFDVLQAMKIIQAKGK